MSLVVPLLSLIPVFTVVLGALVLQEWPSPRQGLGILATAAGVFCIYQPAGIPLSPAAVWRNFRAEPGTAPMLCVAFCWSITAPLDKLALAQAGVGLHALAQVALLSIAAGLWILFSPHKHTDRGRDRGFRMSSNAGRIVLGASLTAGLSYGLQLAAYQQTLVAFVEALKRSIEITAVLVMGLLFLREHVSRNKLMGIALIVCGVPMMILP